MLALLERIRACSNQGGGWGGRAGKRFFERKRKA